MAKSRAEIDKDIMYRKIMPSASRSNITDRNILENKSSNNDSSDSGIGGDCIPKRLAAMSTNAGCDTISSPLSPGTQSPFAAPMRRSAAGLQIPEPQDMALVNLMEDLVLSRLDTTLMRFNCCKCNKCKKDIAAIALNRLKPKYVVIGRGDETKKKQAEEQFGSEVTGALVQAIMLVKKEPRH